MVNFSDFDRIDIRVGVVREAVSLAGARKPAYRLAIDFGEMGLKRSAAQLTDLYRAEELIGRIVVAVVNFPPKLIAGFSSEVLVLGVRDASGGVVLLQPEREVPPGGRIF